MSFRKKLYSSFQGLQKNRKDGPVTTTMTEHSKGECAVAERQWKLYVIVSRFGLKKFSSNTN